MSATPDVENQVTTGEDAKTAEPKDAPIEGTDVGGTDDTEAEDAA